MEPGQVITLLETLTAALDKYHVDAERRHAEIVDRLTRCESMLAGLQAAVQEIHASRNLPVRKSFDVPAAARYAEVTPGTIRRWLADGRLKGQKIGHQRQSRWRIHRKDLDDCLEKNSSVAG